MPKRIVKRRPWEVESEALVVTPAMERRVKKMLCRQASKELAELDAASSADEAFYLLPIAANAAYNLRQFEDAEKLARRLLATAEEFKDNWNYGNALHSAHTVLGLLAIRRGDTQLAAEELRASGAVRGSPQLGSFGPTMRLAKELLMIGQTTAVLDYLEQCRVFWKSGGLWLSIWEKKIRRGAMPNFFMNLHR